MARPCALVVSCCEEEPKNLVKLILGDKDVPMPVALVDSIEAYPWCIETKYYTADIHLCTAKEKTIGNLEFAESVQAVVIYFDSKLESSFDRVKEWMVFIKEFSPEVQLLVCNRCTESTDVTRPTVQHWCLKNNFELVELDPEVDDDDCEDDFPETTGIKRIIQALHAHLWPNMEMKSKPGFSAAHLELIQGAEASNIPETSDISFGAVEKSIKELSLSDSQDKRSNAESEDIHLDTNRNDVDVSESISNDLDFGKILDDCDSAEPSFESLFQQFHQMKEKAQSLPFEERKAYAEKVAVAFWRAIGGDEEEIEGIEAE